MKRNAIIRIILFSLIALVLLCVLLAGLGLSSFAKPVSSQIVSVQSTGEEHEFAPGEVSEIFISWASGDIDIQPADQDTVTVSEERSGGSSMVVRSRTTVKGCSASKRAVASTPSRLLFQVEA